MAGKELKAKPYEYTVEYDEAGKPEITKINLPNLESLGLRRSHQRTARLSTSRGSSENFKPIILDKGIVMLELAEKHQKALENDKEITKIASNPQVPQSEPRPCTPSRNAGRFSSFAESSQISNMFREDNKTVSDKGKDGCSIS